jgi:hypothetical protein
MNQSLKLLFAILLLSVLFVVSAQKHKKYPIDIRAEIGVNHSFWSEHYPPSAYSYSSLYNNIPTSIDNTSYPSFQGGIYFERSINKRFTASAGFLYISRKNKSMCDKVQLQNYYDTSGVSQAYSYKKIWGLVQIPVSIAYRYNRWRLGVGLSFPLFYHSVSNSESFTGKRSELRSSFIWDEDFDFQVNSFAKLEFELYTERKINLFASASHTFFSYNLEKNIYAIGVNLSLSKLMGK